MSIFKRIFQQPSKPSPPPTRDLYSIPSNLTAKEFGKVNVKRSGQEFIVDFTILMEPQGREAEGWQTGVALDSSSSMRGVYGQMLVGDIPSKIIKRYEKQGWVLSRDVDGRRVQSFQKQAYDDAINNGYVKRTKNEMEPLARQFIAYLAGNLDADGGTTVIYWACGDGSAYEVIGDFTEAQCKTLSIEGTQNLDFGESTILTPAVRYFTDRFVDAKRGMYVFITDGYINDLDDVKSYTTFLAKQIAAGKRNPVKCVLIGIGEEIDEAQMIELDNLDTGTDVDIWDHKISKDMRYLGEIFAELVDENMIIAPTATIYDSSGNRLVNFTDGLPAKVTFAMPVGSQWFELEVRNQRYRQTVVLS